VNVELLAGHEAALRVVVPVAEQNQGTETHVGCSAGDLLDECGAHAAALEGR
jgi:hypothetical protein